MPFTVLGRRTFDGPLVYRIEEGDGPVADDALAQLVADALTAWRASGTFEARLAADGELPDMTLRWARGAHGGCPSFGVGAGIAHVWPPDAPCELHLDAGRDWRLRDGAARAAGQRDPSLYATVLHEIGHWLGLGHNPDERMLMFADPLVEAPTEFDLAGLHSLYGGGTAGDGDVLVDAAARLVLRRVAPEGRSQHELFDTDGDGDDELVVWRTDEEGRGTLATYHFSDRGLEATRGPFYFAIVPGSKAELIVEDDGLRWIRSTRGADVYGASFNADGGLEELRRP